MVVAQEYPLHLGLAYLFLVGYLLRTAFLSARLPGAVGVIVSGFTFSFFMQADILEGRDKLQGLAFFLVLLTAGTEISLGDLRGHIMLFAMLPSTLEFLGIAAYGHWVLEYTKVEACVLGTALFCLGDGLVIPKMSEFGRQFPGHSLPRLVFIWAPLEASYALTLFGVLQGLAQPAGEEPVGVRLLLIANLLRLAATLAAGACVGAAAGWLVSRRASLGLPFTGSTVEAYLFVLATALAGFGLSCGEGDEALVPMGFASGSLFQPELMVIVIGCFFAHVVDPEVLHNVETTMGGVWVFGQLVLFSMLGSKTDVGVFAQLAAVFPLLVVGLSLRFMGVVLVTFCTLRARPCACPACLKANTDSALTDACFCFLSTLPRATIQGALGPVPVHRRFFQQDPARAHVRTFISIAARLYIVGMSIVGSVLLDAFGPRLLRVSGARHGRCRASKSVEDGLVETGWTAKERRLTAIQQQKVSQLLTAVEESKDPQRRSAMSIKRASLAADAALGALGALGERRSSATRALTRQLQQGAVAGTPPVSEGRPLLSGRTASRGSSKAGAGRRLSTFTSMHQFEGHQVRVESAPLESDSDEGGEFWDGHEEEEPGFSLPSVLSPEHGDPETFSPL